MNGELEIILPTHNPGEGISRTIASLVSQTNRRFSVLLSDNHSCAGIKYLDAAREQLTGAGITVNYGQPPAQLKRIEHWNWAHAQSRADWLKPLYIGEELKPAFVEKLGQRLIESPKARFIRCDAELPTDWGVESLVAPFDGIAISATEVLNYFPERMDWLSRSIPFTYSRTAWQALGGYSPQLPGSAVLNLNVLFALHFGIENMRETLASADLDHESFLNENHGGRVNYSLELWLILRQAKNYCLAARLPWSEQCLVWRTFTAALRR